MTIGDRIKKQRIKLDMTADELADELGKSRATIYRYENGDIKNLPTTILEPLAEVLHTTPAYLMGWTDDSTNWEEIANAEGISPPNDSGVDPQDWYNMKIATDQDYEQEIADIEKGDIIDSRFEQLTSAYKQLSPLNKDKVVKYSQNILQIQRAEEEQDYLMPNAAHQRTDLTKEELNDKARNKHDDDIMDDPNF